MNIEITHCKLYEFISIANRDNIEFAKYTYADCSARHFVIETGDDPTTEEQIKTYVFEDFCLKPTPDISYNYYVLAILGKSYLMYKILNDDDDDDDDGIFIWVCYTESNHRKKGYISTLLRHLKKIHPEQTIKTHTYNESLKKICLQLGIELRPT